MNCPKCRTKMKVPNGVSTGTHAYRQYKCTSCGYVMYTEEYVNADASPILWKIKKCKRRGTK